MMRWFLWSLAGLLIGLMAHLLAVIAMPALSAKTGFERIAPFAGSHRFAILPPGATPLPLPDPAMVTAFCRYDLAGGPIQLHAPVTAGFLSVSLYTDEGLNFYSLTDRAAANGAIDLGLYTPGQLARVRAEQGPDLPGSLRLQAPAERGVAVLRALVPEPGQQAETEAELAQARCGTG